VEVYFGWRRWVKVSLAGFLGLELESNCFLVEMMKWGWMLDAQSSPRCKIMTSGSFVSYSGRFNRPVIVTTMFSEEDKG
jgi:hypothetical protein